MEADRGLLPVHGFVLAGGQSSRMGRDKAMLLFRGKPLVQIAVETLQAFCEEVSIAGNRDDLAYLGRVVREQRVNIGPVAGVEAGLAAAQREWVMFVPVDVPLVPAELLRRWAAEAMAVNMTVSYLGITHKQPTFCMLRKERLAAFSSVVSEGERRLERALHRTAEVDGVASWMYDEYELYGRNHSEIVSDAVLRRWFQNINTPEDLGHAEITNADSLRE